ncbi:MAG: hypothetical protein ACYTF9_14910, partial [Planctomycetota bacterium]
WQWPIPDAPSLLGAELHVQWRVDDPAADEGMSRTNVARLTFFRDDPTQCGCRGDLDCNGHVDVVDLVQLIVDWGDCDVCGADLTLDGTIDSADLQMLIDLWGGC